jgi:AcrR family transcriptional regulator
VTSAAAPAVPDSESPDLPRAAARRQQLLAVASELFARKGFETTTMRDIAARAGVMAASLYYYYPSKEALFVAVHAASVAKVERAVREAIAGVADPWARLEAAAVAHCEALFDTGGFAVLLLPQFPPGLDDEGVRAQLAESRDAFERMIAPVIEALDLAPDIDRHLFRLHYLTALNNAPLWYRPGRGWTPADVGRQLVRMLRPGGH